MILGCLFVALLALSVGVINAEIFRYRRRNRLMRDHEAVMKRLRQQQEDSLRRSEELRKLQNRNQP